MTTASGAALVGRGQDRRPLVLVSVLAGTFVGTINNSVANVAVLDVIDDLDIDVGAAVWFVTGYVLAFAVLMPVAGRLGDRYGVRRVYLAGLACFTVASAAVAVAPNYPLALAARVAQGISNAPVLPTVMVTVAAAFPAGERGRAMGLWAATNGAAIALGPPIGGWLSEAFGWRAVFWADVPVALAALALGWRWLPGGAARRRGALGLEGGALLTVGLVGVMVGLSQGTEWGWSHPAVAFGLAAGVAALAAFWRHIRRAERPFLDVAVLRNRRYAVLSAIAGLQMVVLFAVLFVVPLLVVTVFDRGVGTAGAVAFVLPVTMVLAGPWMGGVADALGTRQVTGAGAAVLAGATTLLGLALATTSLAVLVVGLVAVGAGVSAIQSPTAAGVAEELDDDNRGVAMGLFHTIRFLAGVLGTAAVAVVFSAVTGGAALEAVGDDRLRRAFAFDLVLTGLVACAAFGASRLVPPRPAAQGAVADGVRGRSPRGEQ